MSDQLIRTALAHHDGHGGVHNDSARGHRIYQSSTMAALLDGIYDGDVTVGDLLTHGDFGLGTFNRLDGEMVVLEGTCYHLRSDGSATRATNEDRTPFAVITRFDPDSTAELRGLDRTGLTATIDARVPSLNLFYAIRIDGQFRFVKTRTVAEQHRPYPALTKAVGEQVARKLEKVRGTIVGFRMPDYEQGISVAGYHLHFIDDPRQHGGHVMDFDLDQGHVALSTSSELRLSVPRSGPFLTADLSPEDADAQIHATEG